jgi:hypothetical protein
MLRFFNATTGEGQGQIQVASEAPDEQAPNGQATQAPGNAPIEQATQAPGNAPNEQATQAPVNAPNEQPRTGQETRTAPKAKAKREKVRRRPATSRAIIGVPLRHRDTDPTQIGSDSEENEGYEMQGVIQNGALLHLDYFPLLIYLF